VGEPITRVTLFIPCAKSVDQAVLRGIAPLPDVDWIENDGEFGTAFSFGTVSDEVIERLEAAPGALVLHWPIDLRAGRSTIVSAVERVRDTGGIAVRIEQSKLGWDVTRWLELFSSDDAWAWHRGAIAFLGEDDALQSCGMHAFSLPDVRISVDDDEAELREMGSLFNVYQLAEDPLIRSGQTFAPAKDVSRRIVERWPDTSYPPSHACHNPYGVWRIGPPGGTGRKLPELVPVFVPTLRAILMALEQKRGARLTKREVEDIRDKGVCMAMDPRDAQKLERERGYADLDPELAWEQWKLVQPR
jgi:hypothetical protein